MLFHGPYRRGRSPDEKGALIFIASLLAKKSKTLYSRTHSSMILKGASSSVWEGDSSSVWEDESDMVGRLSRKVRGREG
jgi:hypothetical protein